MENIDKEKNYELFYKYLMNIIGPNSLESLIEQCGGKEKLMNASYATSDDTGLAFDGSLISTLLEICEYASKINSILPYSKMVTNKEIYKVVLLSQISKAIMFSPNTNDWEIKNRGIKYKFNEFNSSLRLNERSILMAMNAGIQFTETEFEAMRVLDKQKENDNYTQFYSSTLSVVIRNALDLINLIHKR